MIYHSIINFYLNLHYRKKKEIKTRDKTEIRSASFTLTSELGEKKDVSQSFEEYHPKYVEAAWYEWWEKSGFFSPDTSSDKEPFVIMLPPPNVTGHLHIGHALTAAIQDCLVRYNRMKGRNTLYLPGIDHAGISTQVVVEKQLWKSEKKTRHNIGRENFISKVWEWKNEKGSHITTQLRRLGSSLDWNREVFTMDDNLSKAVTEAFVRLYEKGEIYRSNRLVNWSCTLNTAISNIEVKHLELEGTTKLSVPGYEKKIEFGSIWSFAYPIEGEDGREIVVATTRPETMLGDTAIAVHPEDERYKDVVGKFVIHPFNQRKIPIIADSMVEMGFGTGAVKITPAHDPNDFEVGKRHNLPFINILNDNGTINENGFPYEGKKRFDVRYEIIDALTKLNLFKGKEPNKMSIGLCERSKDVIEPMLKPQWYVDCTKPAAQACEAVRNGTLRIYPEREERTWFHFLENIQPWCISRQLWWGHRVPAYFVTIKGRDPLDRNETESWIVGRNIEEAKTLAAKKFQVNESEIDLSQDEDVLDTWFSSGLFPFSTLGWPNTESIDFKKFFPNSVLETGVDILFFWVARMVMQSLQLTGELPFKTVILHSMVRDKVGRKMSKSLGNVIDPIDCIEGATLESLEETIKSGNLAQEEIEKALKSNKSQFPKGIPECGTDALRFTLLNYTSANMNDINMDTDKAFEHRAFCNKMWNAFIYATNFFGIKDYVPTHGQIPDPTNFSFFNQWILSRLNTCVVTVTENLEKFNFMDVTNTLESFFYKEFCGVFLEIIKPLFGIDEIITKQTQFVLYTCLETFFRLLHPVMPFITEELWQRLPGRNTLPANKASIMINDYPVAQSTWDNKASEVKMDLIMKIVTALRRLKNSYSLTNKHQPAVFIVTTDETSIEIIKGGVNEIKSLAITGEITITTKENAPSGCAIEVVNGEVTANMLLKGLIDPASEIAKIEKKYDSLKKVYSNLVTRRGSEAYNKVPDNVKASDSEKLIQYEAQLKQMEEAIADLKKL